MIHAYKVLIYLRGDNISSQLKDSFKSSLYCVYKLYGTIYCIFWHNPKSGKEEINNPFVFIFALCFKRPDFIRI